jgi:D-glycero-D-manno-heptose 1,7-bisphosphate phosphatase
MALDLSRSFMVGDRWLDVECGRAAGVRPLLVRTGHGAHEEASIAASVQADAILNNLMEAVGWILRSS